jgi:hypothetical protein
MVKMAFDCTSNDFAKVNFSSYWVGNLASHYLKNEQLDEVDPSSRCICC